MDLCNARPLLYIGRDKQNGSYYFLGEDQGDGKFLAYQTYPYWMNCFGPTGNHLDLNAELPAEIMAEVILFVNGRVRYEIIPENRSLGIPRQIIQHEIQIPTSKQAGKTKIKQAETESELARLFVSETDSDSNSSSEPSPGKQTERSEQDQGNSDRPERRRGRPRKVANTHMA